METIALSLNPSQRVFHDNCYHVKLAHWVASRGTGKSSRGVGAVIRNFVHFCPRSKPIIGAESFKTMLDVTLPSTIRGLESFGYYRDVHYVIGIKPPKAWPMAYEPPTHGFKNVMSWINGTMFQLVSQDSGATSARGLNTDGFIGDESAHLDKDHYDEEILPTIRANQDEFKNVPFHLGEFFFGSMPYGKSSKWFTDLGDYYLRDGSPNLKLMDILIEIQLDFLKENNMQKKAELWNECLSVRKAIQWYSKRVDRIQSFYMESNTFDNIEAMGYNYIHRAYSKTGIVKFMTEFMNKRHMSVEGGFYKTFNRERDTYKRYWGDLSLGVTDAEVLLEAVGDEFDLDQTARLGSMADRDCIDNLPLCIGSDFGGNINCIVVGQELENLNRFNLINDFYVKTPGTIKDVASKFINYYRFHKEKLVYVYCDASGNNSVANSKLTYIEELCTHLRDAGWTVVSMTTGNNPYHHRKHLFYQQAWGGDLETLILINSIRCDSLITSIEGTKVKEVNDMIKKDKSKEGQHLETEERQPHLSDAMDYLLFAKYSDVYSVKVDYIPNSIR